MSILKANVVVSGRVQGVGYRAWTKKEALLRSLTGWVKNLPDGKVEANFEGEAASVHEMLEVLKNGPAFSKVLGLEVTFNDQLENAKDFQILK